jgi:hypothetical protein
MTEAEALELLNSKKKRRRRRSSSSRIDSLASIQSGIAGGASNIKGTPGA